jgi:hypothetical protein
VCYIRRQLSEEAIVKSGIPQMSVLGPLLFLAYVNDIWRNLEPTDKLFADDCIIYRKITNYSDVERLQIDLYRQRQWAVENAMEINPGKSKANWLRAGRSGDRIPVVARFPAPVQTGPGAHPPSCTIGTWSFLGVKRPERGADHPPPSSAEVRKE